jgi:hypothetical protein
LCTYQTLRQAYHSLRRVLPGVSNCMWSRNLNNEAVHARCGL